MVHGRKIAALEMEQDEEFESLVREVAGEDRANGSGGLRTIVIQDDSGAASSRVWKLLAFVLFGIVVLFATDSIELKITNKGEFKEGDVEDREDVTDNPFIGDYKPVTTPEEALAQNTTAKGDANHVDVTQHVEHGAGDSSNTGSIDGADKPASPDNPNSPCPTRTYKSRAQPIDDAEKARLASEWGSWTLVDDKSDQRPKHDFYADYPNRDIPRSEFPSNAWQLDKDYVGKFLTEGIALANRAMEAILSEYGHGKEDEPDVPFANRSQMFDVIMFEGNLTDVQFEKEYSQNGWTTKRSWANLKKRVLHSIMTQDSFIFAMGGHSAAAGHGYVVLNFVVSGSLIGCFSVAGVVVSLTITISSYALFWLPRSLLEIIFNNPTRFKSRGSWNRFSLDWECGMNRVISAMVASGRVIMHSQQGHFMVPMLAY